MNRIIKFRAWDKYESKMLYLRDIVHDAFLIMFFHGILMGEHSVKHMGVIHEFIPMQFTGLTDKNGKEIYEGDIVKYDSFMHTGTRNCPVMFVDGRFVANDITLGFRGINKDKVEVIGNIYENPNLLERKEDE